MASLDNAIIPSPYSPTVPLVAIVSLLASFLMLVIVNPENEPYKLILAALISFFIVMFKYSNSNVGFSALAAILVLLLKIE